MNTKFTNLIVLLQKTINDSTDFGDSILLEEIANYINSTIDNSIIYDFLNSKVEINQDSFNFDDNIPEELLKNIINYFHKDGNIYTYYDSEIFHSDNELNKKILFYFKTIELITSYFIVHNERTIIIYSKYSKYISTLVELFRIKVYKYLGYDEIPPYKIWNYQTQMMSENKSEKIDKVILKLLKFVDSYKFKKQTIDYETKDFLIKYYNIWWEKYKDYIGKNFPALSDKLEYYNGLNLDIYFCKFNRIDENRFGTSDMALCVGMSKNNSKKIDVNIREEIHQILFLNEIYPNIDDVVITLAFDSKTFDSDLSTIVNIEIPDKVNDSVINYYKETIDYENYIKFSKKLLEEIGQTVLNKANSLIVDDYITNEKKYYTLEYSQNTSKEIVEDLSKRKKKENNLLIINKNILSKNIKNKYIENNIYIKDIYDIFYMFSKIKRKTHILNNLIYPYLETKVGSLQNKYDTTKLINEFKNCPLGKKGWQQFENIILKVLHYVFEESFRKFLISSQSYNLNGTDIKDYIISNNGIHEFWKDVKQIYKCNNIVIECKNYTNKIGVNELRQVSDYLGKETYGQFGIIFSRKGIDDNGKKKQNEYLMLNPKKLILVLDETDIIDLIRAKNMNDYPEEILEVIKFNTELET